MNHTYQITYRRLGAPPVMEVVEARDEWLAIAHIKKKAQFHSIISIRRLGESPIYK